MEQLSQFTSATEERWSGIRDFPGYSVSDQGRVLNDATGFPIKAVPNTKGLYIVGLMCANRQYKRSLPLIVAREFVPNTRAEFDTPINLNGDRADNTYTNLAWRPLWFARKYGAQFKHGDYEPSFDRPIEDIETGEVYKNSKHAAIVNGLLDYEIFVSMVNNTYVIPSGQIFREALDR